MEEETRRLDPGDRRFYNAGEFRQYNGNLVAWKEAWWLQSSRWLQEDSSRGAVPPAAGVGALRGGAQRV